MPDSNTPPRSGPAPHPNCTPEQLAAIERFKQEKGIDPTAIVNLVMKMRERPALEQALAKAAQAASKKADKKA